MGEEWEKKKQDMCERHVIKCKGVEERDGKRRILGDGLRGESSSPKFELRKRLMVAHTLELCWLFEDKEPDFMELIKSGGSRVVVQGDGEVMESERWDRDQICLRHHNLS